MISVLIPVFNKDVTELVSTLSSQLLAEKGGEILVIDDGSDLAFRSLNSSIKQFDNVQYIELQQNVGRLEVRRLLAEKADNEWLLFLDGDSQIQFSGFLNTYIQSFSKGYDVVVGGRQYPSELPQDCTYRLHWKYGKLRENAIHQRTGFMTNNFCIKKNLFQQLVFDLPWRGYGHEDTWIGIQLENLNANICYIENYVDHNGIESCEVFLKKSRGALENLLLLAKRYEAATVSKHVRLFRYYSYLNATHLSAFITSIFKLFQTPILKNLYSCAPSLWVFDFYRLSHFIMLAQALKKVAIRK